jgi:hypothetical protein
MAQYFALAILTMGIVNTIGSDDLLGAFAAGECTVTPKLGTYSSPSGCTFTSWEDDENSPSIHSTVFTFADVLDYILNCGCFIYIGAWFRWEDFTSSELGIRPWKLVVLSIGILILRRLPALLLLYKWVPEIKDVNEALFCGYFGESFLSFSVPPLNLNVIRPSTCQTRTMICIDNLPLFVDGRQCPFYSHSSQTQACGASQSS